MRKILSIVLSLAMLLSVSVASVNAYALVGSIESTKKQNKVVLEVNGKVSTDIEYDYDDQDPNKITFTYTGDGELIGWEFPGMVEGVDYEIISQDGNSITILVYDSYTGDVTANAIVREREETTESTTGKETTTKETTTKKGETTTKETTTKETTTKKDEGGKSPKTGAASAVGIAALGAGAAILTALKKKEDAE